MNVSTVSSTSSQTREVSILADGEFEFIQEGLEAEDMFDTSSLISPKDDLLHDVVAASTKDVLTSNSPSQFFLSGNEISTRMPSQLIERRAIHTPNSLEKGTHISRNQIVLVASILRTYPKMLLRRNTLPPFIHPVSYLPPEKDTSNAFPEPLEICINIVHAFATARGNEAGSVLLRSIDEERMRVVREVRCT